MQLVSATHRRQLLSLADINNCQQQTHPRNGPYLHQAVIKLHRGNRTLSKLRSGRLTGQTNVSWHFS